MTLSSFFTKKRWQGKPAEGRTTGSQAMDIPNLPEEVSKEKEWPSLPTTRTHQKEVSTSDKHEHQKSEIEHLPAEMLLAIDKYLPESSQFAFRTTSSELYVKLGALTWKNEAMYGTYARLIRFDEACEAARTEKTPDRWSMKRKESTWHENMCSYCKEEHHPSLFSSKQLAGPPETRKCIGAGVAVKVCSCYSITWAQLVNVWHADRKNDFCDDIQAAFDLHHGRQQPKGTFHTWTGFGPTWGNGIGVIMCRLSCEHTEEYPNPFLLSGMKEVESRAIVKLNTQWVDVDRGIVLKDLSNGSHLTVSENSSDVGNEEHTIMSDYREGKDPRLTPEALLKALKELDEPMCSHFRSGDNVWKSLDLWQWPPVAVNPDREDFLPNSSYPAYELAKGFCREDQCNTTFEIYKWIGAEKCGGNAMKTVGVVKLYLHIGQRLYPFSSKIHGDRGINALPLESGRPNGSKPYVETQKSMNWRKPFKQTRN